MLSKTRPLTTLCCALLGWAAVTSHAAANTQCKRTDPKLSNLHHLNFTIFDQFETPWVTFQGAASPSDCHPCLRAYDAQLGLLRTAIVAIASPRSHNHEARAAVLSLVSASSDVLTHCRVTAVDKPLKRLSLCKEWRATTSKYLEQVLLTQFANQPFTAHQLLFWRIGSLVRECALDR